CAVRIQLDIVANGVGGKEAVNPTSRDQIVLDNEIQESVGFGEDLTRLSTVLLVLQNAVINPFQLPGVEERCPVDEVAQRCERKVVQHAHTRKCGYGQVFRTPPDRSPPCARGLKRNDRL